MHRIRSGHTFRGITKRIAIAQISRPLVHQEQHCNCLLTSLQGIQVVSTFWLLRTHTSLLPLASLPPKSSGFLMGFPHTGATFNDNDSFSHIKAQGRHHLVTFEKVEKLHDPQALETRAASGTKMFCKSRSVRPRPPEHMSG